MDGPILAGTLRPAVRIKVDGRTTLYRLPTDDYATAGSVAAHIAQQLDVSCQDLGIRLDSEGPGAYLGDNCEVESGQLLLAEIVSTLSLHVLVPEGKVAADGSREGLPDVQVMVDGREVGQTDSSGTCQVALQVGKHQVCLHHSSFVGGHRTLNNVSTMLGRATDVNVFADIKLYVYATDPEEDEEGEYAGGAAYGDAAAAYGAYGQPDSVDPLMADLPPPPM